MGRAPKLFALRHRSELVDRLNRRGLARRRLIIALVALSGIGGGGWHFLGRSVAGGVEDAPLTSAVFVGKFVHEVVERGDIESSANVEVRSEVQLRGNNNASGVAILELVPEGTFVEEGDFLVRLDDSTLQNDLQLQQINCNSSAAVLIQARTAVETAKLALKEYQEGTFRQAEEQIQSEIFIAEENSRRAVEYLRYSERLAAKGYVSPIQLDADRFAVDKAAKELEVAKTKHGVLRDFTRQKMVKQLEADVKTAEAKMGAALQINTVEETRLEKIKTQIAKCIITAPRAGQVVYANQPGIGNNDAVVIEEGRIVRERQVLIRLPNPKQMQVVAKINESRIDMIRPGMKTRVKVDAIADFELEGIVRKVSEYPTQQNSSLMSHIKEYETEIEIINPPDGLRPGMTAQAAVLVEERPEAAQVPLQAVIERNGHFYCLVHGPEGLSARQVQIGPTNDKFVVIEKGLAAGEQIAMAPKQFSDRIELPTPVEYPSKKPTLIARSRKIDNTPRLAKNDETLPAERKTGKRLKTVGAVSVEANSPTQAAGL
jgi:multidrug efflux pump subunit AcrA (membrane-fusion protein)